MCILYRENHQIPYAQNEEWRKRCYYMRREFDDSHDIEYTFHTSNNVVFKYLTEYLKSQKATKGSKTYGEALTSIVGTTIESPDLRYCNYIYSRSKDGETEITDEDRRLIALRKLIAERNELKYL